MKFVFGFILCTLFLFPPAECRGEEPRRREQRPEIRRVTIEIREVFDEPDLAWFYRTANTLKIETRQEVVRRELLFKEGDAYDHFLLEESERNLRALPFLRQVSITPSFDGRYVDLLVSVQDTWTLYPAFTFSSGGGTSNRSISLIEGNVLGYGKRFELLYADDEGREKIEGVWDDRRLFGTKQRLILGRFDRSDGYRTVAFYGKPFQSLADTQSWGSDVDDSDTVERLFEGGEERFIFRQKHQSFSGWGSLASGDPEVMISRFSLGYDYLRDRFKMPTEQDFEDVDVDPDSVSLDPSLLPKDRKFSAPFAALQQIEPDYVSLDYVDRFDRVEDFNLGAETNLKVGLAPEALGSDGNTILFSTGVSDGRSLGPDAFIRGEIGFSSRIADYGGMQNNIAHGELIFVNRHGEQYWRDYYLGRHTLIADLLLDWGWDLDGDVEFLLGAAEGLRGYEDRTFTGDQRLLFNIEDRIFLIDDVFRLVSLGGVAFFDAGGTSKQGLGTLIADEIRSDLGLGIRLGFPRSQGGSVVRIDLAFPTREGPDGTQPWQPRLLISTGQLVNAKFQSETAGRSNLTIGPSW